MEEFGYEDLVAWARERLPRWQQDTLRRLLATGPLSAGDVDELVKLAKAPYESSNGTGPVAVGPSKDDIRPGGEGLPAVRLKAVREIERANALGEGPIPFGETNLTVVYGGNASGKSGIARILKRACRARDPGRPILPNVFERPSGAPARATIDFVVERVEDSVDWTDGESVPEALRTVSVFDAQCAAVQVNEANRIFYNPAILQTFEELARTVTQVSDKINEEKAMLGGPPAILRELEIPEETEAGQFVKGLSSRSDPEKLRSLCRVSEDERKRLAELDRALKEDPARTAEAEEERLRGIEKIDELARLAEARLNARERDRMVHAIEERNRTSQAAEAARRAFAESSSLEGIGTDTWRRLWEAARRYSETHAYVGEDYPVVRDGALCVLCQQPLSTAGAGRLHSFEEFVQSDVQKEADEAREAVDGLVSGLGQIGFPRSVRRELRRTNLDGRAVGEEIRRFLVRGRLLRRRLEQAARGSTTPSGEELPSRPDLQGVRSEVEAEARRLREASRAAERREMEQERGELRARVDLAEHFQSISDEIGRLQQVKVLENALGDCKTGRITRKEREAADSVVTKRLQGNFERNLTAVGFPRSPVQVALGAGEYGSHPYKMRLMAQQDAAAGDVLSEGERTCVALAGFFAELETTGNRSGAVFDDPVSSLDHQYRKRVAERLVEEAKRRQIVIFTHDWVFLYLLRKYQGELGVDAAEITVEAGYRGGHGRASQGAPWEAMRARERIGSLRRELVSARKILQGGNRGAYERRASEIYKRLRMTWERAVEEVLLNETVLRFGDSVQTTRLRKLTDIQEDDVETVRKEVSRCSDFEHDESGAVSAAPPEPDVVQEDIDRLDEWVLTLRRERGRG